MEDPKPTWKRQPTWADLLRALGTLALDALAALRAPKEPFTCLCAGRTTRGTLYRPDAGGAAPAVLVLHTASGVTPHEHAIAARLARRGFAALVVAYSKRTTGAVLNDDARRRELELAVEEAWRALRQDPRVAADRVAVMGFSLGGYFATHLGGLPPEAAPRAVVVYYGMYPQVESLHGRLTSPLLILQGDRDSPDFVANAARARAALPTGSYACELVTYPGAGHQFDLFRPRSQATRDAWARSLAFLERHIGHASG